ncbi:hypothetical protein VNO77_44019 [Canavalia gladiata]|uniref:Uncharacterized protein n=1 Tax=Canavalia gladiata TaxID=3824 RepID=A0AAN9JYV6_CANGL
MLSEATTTCPILTINCFLWHGIVVLPFLQSMASQLLEAQGSPKASSNSVGQEAENCLLNAVTIHFPEHLNLVWKIIFPSAAAKRCQ